MFKLLNYRRNQILRIVLLINLFGFLSIIDQWYKLNSGPELAVRLTTGLAFMIYVINPYRKWLVIVLLQIALTYLFNSRQQLYENLILVGSETLTSVISAIIFRIINKSNFYLIDAGNILKIMLSGIIGSLIGGFVAAYALNIFNPAIYHSSLWITWFLSSIAGIVLMAPVIVGWRSIKI